MIYKQIFELNKTEIKMIEIAKDKTLSTNWCKEGKVQEKGGNNENLVCSLLKLFDDIEVLQSSSSTELDEVLKVDVVIRLTGEFEDVFAFQIKSSLIGAEMHYEKYYPFISYEGKQFRTPWCLIVKGFLTNKQLFHFLEDELCLTYSIDFEFLDSIHSYVIKDNNKMSPIKNFRKLTRKELVCLRLFYNIGKKEYVYYLKT